MKNKCRDIPKAEWASLVKRVMLFMKLKAAVGGGAPGWLSC